jgi:hypothetical protein
MLGFLKTRKKSKTEDILTMGDPFVGKTKHILFTKHVRHWIFLAAFWLVVWGLTTSFFQ